MLLKFETNRIICDWAVNLKVLYWFFKKKKPFVPNDIKVLDCLNSMHRSVLCVHQASFVKTLNQLRLVIGYWLCVSHFANPKVV